MRARHRKNRFNKLMTIHDAIPGKKYRICSMNAGRKLNSHLCSMGILPHETFTISSKSYGGPMAIFIKGSRIALGKRIASKIIIREVNNGK